MLNDMKLQKLFINYGTQVNKNIKQQRLIDKK